MEDEDRKGTEDGTVGVVGAGVAGLSCARRLSQAGVPVTVLDRGRGPAGRAATRRVEIESGHVLRFDHGAQYFTVRDGRFREAVDGWIRAGAAAPWEGRIGRLPPDGGGRAGRGERAGRWVGVPGMSAVGRHLARGLEVQWRTDVGAVRPAREGRGGPPWTLVEKGGSGAELGPFRAVVLALPAPQAAPLLEGAAGAARGEGHAGGAGTVGRLAAAAAGHETRPCWAAMAAFGVRLPVPVDGAFVREGPVDWAARNSSKPGRAAWPDAWVLHASPAWSAERLDDPPAEVAAELLQAFFRAAGLDHRDPLHLAGHRWRYARSAEPREEGALAAGDAGVVLAGDWLAGDRVEGAWVSGRAAAERLLEGGLAHRA